jgi:hypothetical protein
MEPNGFILLVVFSVLFAMGYQWLTPRIFANDRLQKYQGSYAGRTGLTAASVLVLLVVVSLVMSSAYRKPALPSA